LYLLKFILHVIKIVFIQQQNEPDFIPELNCKKSAAPFAKGCRRFMITSPALKIFSGINTESILLCCW